MILINLYSWLRMKQPFNKVWLSIISIFVLFTGCINEEVITNLPKSGPEKIQLHNFNAPLNGGSLDGTAPDIYYFRQKQDGTYLFTLTYDANYQAFETSWKTDYVLVTADITGVIQNIETMKFPVKDGINANFEGIFDAGTPSSDSPLPKFNIDFFSETSSVGPNYVADDLGMLYFLHDYPCACGNLFFNLQPETGQTELISVRGGGRTLPQTFRTSDGGFITVGGVLFVPWDVAPDYHKFSAAGKLEFKQQMRYWEMWPAHLYLTDRNGDIYFIATYNSPKWPFSRWITENTAKSFYYVRSTFINMAPSININMEIRFGPGKGQKAHRFNRGYFVEGNPIMQYQDYVDVPFEVWDITNNQQLAATFRDQGEDGAFNLIPLNIIYDFDDMTNNPNQSQEWISGYPNIPYTDTPNEVIKNTGGAGQDVFAVFGYLTDGATWDPKNLPSSSVSLNIEPKPGTQIIKVNANGSFVVKDNYTLGTVPLQNMFKAVPYQDGSAVLINVSYTNSHSRNSQLQKLSVTNPKTQLAILDADFNQTTVVDLVASSADKEHQLEYSKEKDRVFYARMTNNPNASPDIVFKGSLLVSVIKDNSIKAQKYLDEFIPFKLEKYRMTPTKSGGVAIAAWVRPTKDTRDLLFFELDENLELVKR